jgi:hypothetical protein
LGHVSDLLNSPGREKIQQEMELSVKNLVNILANQAVNSASFGSLHDSLQAFGFQLP